MRRLVLVLALALCALTPQAAAAATEVEAEFKLPASGGLEADVEARGDEVALAVLDADHAHSSGRYSVYVAKGETSETGVEASFGALGHISLQFHASSTRSDSGGPRCKQRWTYQEGFFEGEAAFRGENGYVTIDVHKVEGELEIRPCQTPTARALRPRAVPPGGKPQRETGALLARAKDGRLFLANGESDPRHGRHFESFTAELLERREGMRIGRLAYASVEKPGRFRYDHGAGAATVQPPGPFSGKGSFTRRGSDQRQKGSWRGDLSVRLLGHEPISLTGPEFKTVLLRHSPVHDE